MVTEQTIIEELQTVFDPEFPIVDIRTMGLIYKISIDNDAQKVHLLMTFTTPACPAADQLLSESKEALERVAPGYMTDIEITFDPMRNLDMMKDPDLKRMFE